jgi:hypothetical protein
MGRPKRRVVPAADAARTHLSKAQTALLLRALSSHPAPVRDASPRVATALRAAGLLAPHGSPQPATYVLTAAGLDAAARLSAQAVIDAVNARRASSDGAKESSPRDRGAGGDTPSQRPAGAPANWPFPVSGHAW